jgi:dolichol kinase
MYRILQTQLQAHPGLYKLQIGLRISEEIRTELVRKSIHMLIGLVPLLASSLGVAAALGVLTGGAVFYSWAEFRRRAGFSVFVVSQLTVFAARTRDKDRFVLGPVTLALGAMIALMLYPEPAATVAIYALAFGDGFSSIVGKLVGEVRIPFTGGKTLEGSLACFFSVFAAATAVTGRVVHAFWIALLATIIEALPLRDLDNIILPVGTGLATSLLMALL